MYGTKVAIDVPAPDRDGKILQAVQGVGSIQVRRRQWPGIRIEAGDLARLPPVPSLGDIAP